MNVSQIRSIDSRSRCVPLDTKSPLVPNALKLTSDKFECFTVLIRIHAFACMCKLTHAVLCINSRFFCTLRHISLGFQTVRDGCWWLACCVKLASPTIKELDQVTLFSRSRALNLFSVYVCCIRRTRLQAGSLDLSFVQMKLVSSHTALSFVNLLCHESEKAP